jgi:molybdopterin-biosynthesis enzyme MoeA-like protein
MNNGKTACLIIIGNEILSGRTHDTNLPYLGQRLDQLGVRLKEGRVIADVESAIVAAVNECRINYDYVFTSGGIGPTHDDITTASVAAAFGVEVKEDPEARRRLVDFYSGQGLTPARLKMARVPAGAKLIDNPISAAPGFQLDNVFVLAGIPAVFKAMVETLAGRLSGGLPMLNRSLTTSLREGQLAAGLSELQERYHEVLIGSYPFFRDGRHGVSVVCRGTDDTRLRALLAELEKLVDTLGGTVVDKQA